MNDRNRPPTPTGGDVGRKARPRRPAHAGAQAPPRNAHALCAGEACSSGNGASGTMDRQGGCNALQTTGRRPAP